MAVNGYDVAQDALKYKGTKFTWGGTDLSSGTDSSGFVQSLLKQHGIMIPRVTYDQINDGNRISMSDLQPGDLVFFDADTRQDSADHVGMYVGNGQFIHNSRKNGKATVDSLLDENYAGRWMGGRRPVGMLGGGVDSENEKLGINTQRGQQEPEELASNYGWSWAMLSSQPELKKLFQTAVAEDWDEKRFSASIDDTEWWKTTSETARQAQMMQASDPATWNAQINATAMKLRMFANEMGALVPESMMGKIAEDVLRTGMGDEQIRATLGGYITFTDEGTLGGRAGQAGFKLKQLAYMNGVQVSDDAVKNYAQQIAMGVSTMEQAEQYVRNMASSMFPTYKDQIDAGGNMMDIASPYMQILSEEMEINPGEVNLFDPRVKQALNGIDESGKPIGMSLTDFQKSVRTSPEWLKTNKAQTQLMSTANAVLKDMGMVT